MLYTPGSSSIICDSLEASSLALHHFIATTCVVEAGSVGLTIAAEFFFMTKKATPPPMRAAPPTPPTTAPTITPVLSSELLALCVAWDWVVVGDPILVTEIEPREVPVTDAADWMLLTSVVAVAPEAAVETELKVTVAVASSTLTTKVM